MIAARAISLWTRHTRQRPPPGGWCQSELPFSRRLRFKVCRKRATDLVGSGGPPAMRFRDGGTPQTLPALGFRRRWGSNFAAPRRRHGREVLRQGRPTMRVLCRCGRVLRGSPVPLAVRRGLGPGDLASRPRRARVWPGDPDRANRGKHEAKGVPSGGPDRARSLAPRPAGRGPWRRRTPRSRVSRREAEPSSDARAGPARVSSRKEQPGLRSPSSSHRSPNGILRSRCRLRLGGKTPGRSRSEPEWERPIGGRHRGWFRWQSQWCPSSGWRPLRSTLCR